MKKIAFYGKGGIGKSTTASNVSAALSLMEKKVCQIGCDPKNDSTRLLLGHICKETVLDQVRRKNPDEISREDIVHTGFHGITCVEAGGPEPGVGCAGRGIIVALQLLDKMKAIPDMDVTLYDVLGDVVCGGFSMPIREGYAKEIYIVSSGELMSLYAANNIAKGIRRFATRGEVRLACSGIVFFDNLTEDDKKTLREEIAAVGDIPIYDSREGQAVMDACDILLTTNEIYNTKARQLFIPMVPLTGTEGEIAELRAMYRLLCRYGKKGGVAYVTV